MRAKQENELYPVRRRARIGIPLICSIAAAGLLTIAASAYASAAGNVDVGGVRILTIRVPADGMSVRQRANVVTDRLRFMLGNPNLKPSNIVAAPLGRNRAEILVDKRLLVTIEPRAARMDDTTPMRLAHLWVAHLRRVLPRVNVKPNPNLEGPAMHARTHRSK